MAMAASISSATRTRTSTTPPPSRASSWATARGSFVEDPAFAALDIRGFGETILAADFNNDGAVDLFIPFYSHNDPREHSYLLINDGTGHFTDIADKAGVALRGVPLSHRVEGAQAVDYDGDGWIDFYVAGRLFHNNGNLTFTDVTDAVGLPGDFDEGIKFIDWNNDGLLDLIIHHPIFGPALWEFDGARFTRRDVMPQYFNWDMYGFNVADLNGDGREDVIVASGALQARLSAAEHGRGFERDPLTLIDNISFSPGCRVRLRRRWRHRPCARGRGWPTVVARNISPGINRQTLVIEVVDATGRRNQFGRVVRIRPANAPGVTMTRVVDGGSGMLAQTPYPLTVPTPYAGTHSRRRTLRRRNVSFTMRPGERVRVFADGRTVALLSARKSTRRGSSSRYLMICRCDGRGLPLPPILRVALVLHVLFERRVDVVILRRASRQPARPPDPARP